MHVRECSPFVRYSTGVFEDGISSTSFSAWRWFFALTGLIDWRKALFLLSKA